MTLDLNPLIQAIQNAGQSVKSQMDKLAKAGSQIQVASMIKLQLTMNKFSQIADLGSTSVALFAQSFKSMINNVLRAG